MAKRFDPIEYALSLGADADSNIFDFLTNLLGLPKPYESYSPRSQRRFRQARKQGITPKEQYRRERVTRVKGAKAKKYAKQVLEYAPNLIDTHDNDSIEELVDFLGSAEAAELLHNQLKAYRGDIDPRDNYYNVAEMDHTNDRGEYLNLNPYGYYH